MSALTVVAVAGCVYFAAVTASHLLLAAVAWRAVEDYVRRRPLRDYRSVATSPMTLPVSILMPAYNEGPVIVPALQALLASQFVNLEVVVVDDGSTDDTLRQLQDGFELIKTDRVPRADLGSKPVVGVYAAPGEPRIVVLAKENGGKADALNAALRYARYPLVCAVDADTILDPAALSRLVWEFQADPTTIATGGIVRVLNGSSLEDGRIGQVRAPRSVVANIQILEYLRAFLGARIGWSRAGMLLIISGAFGLFRRDALVAVGGYDATTVGEDGELVLRLHRHFRERREPYRITFFPDSICWTEAPADMRTVARQRDRWQRGLLEMLWKHRSMICRRRYGRIGCVALPYYVLFEALGPIVEIVATVGVVAGVLAGVVSPAAAALFGVLGVLSGMTQTFVAIMLEERAFRRYPSWRCLRRLLVAGVVEVVLYRPVLTVVRARACLTVLGSRPWGEMSRVGFSASKPAVKVRPAARAA